MEEDSPSNKPIEKLEEKAISKAIDGVSTFFGKICMPIANELGIIVQNNMAYYRLKNLISITEKTEKLLKNKKISGNSNPKLIKEILEESSWESDENIQAMWAGLISNSANDEYGETDGFAYLPILKQLTPFQAKLINNIYTDPRTYSIEDTSISKSYSDL